MSLPFTLDEFLDVFTRYHASVGPAPWLLAALAFGLIWIAGRGTPLSRRTLLWGLSALWAWMGIVYHLVFFRSINPAASVFGAAFVAQAIVFATLAVRLPRSVRAPGAHGVVKHLGTLLIVYAVAVYPTLGFLLGHRYPAAPTFGLPCPTTIFTLGLVLWTMPSIPWWSVIVPLAWTIVGTSAAVQLGMHEDFGLLVAGVLFILVRLARHPVEHVEPRSA